MAYDGMVSLHGLITTAEHVRINAEYHMDGFDELPKEMRDAINYAETCETGALPTRELVKALRRGQDLLAHARAIAAAFARRSLE